MASRSWLRRQLQHCGQGSGAPLLYRSPESRPLAGSPTPGGPTGFPRPPLPGDAGRPCSGRSAVSGAVSGTGTLWSAWGLHPLLVPGAPYTGLRKAVGEERATHRPAKGQLAAENDGVLLEKVKQGEETGNSFLLRTKSCHPECDNVTYMPQGLLFYCPQPPSAKCTPVRCPWDSCISYLHISLCWTMAS